MTTYSTIWVFLMCVLTPHVFGARPINVCHLKVTDRSTEKFSPVFLYNDSTTDFELIVSENGYIDLEEGERITLLCSDNRNYLTLTNSNATYATCVEGGTLRIEERNRQLDEIQCKKSVRGDVFYTRDRCAQNKGRILNIGYRINRNKWVTLIDVCYDAEAGNTFYTKHVIHGEAIKYASKSSFRPGFSTAGLGPDIAASVAYKQAFQKSTFNQLFGSSLIASQYINGKSYLARGHLSPDADFLFATSQFTTYYFINTCPQWQAINGGNWKSIEMTVRKTAEYYSDTFSIITGTHGVLAIPDENGNDVEIFLVSGEKLPVPKFVWKIIYDEDTSRGIVLIILNNPFAQEITESDLLCDDICDQHGWGSNSWSDISRGYVQCCDIKEFSRTVKTVPLPNVNGILRGMS